MKTSTDVMKTSISPKTAPTHAAYTATVPPSVPQNVNMARVVDVPATVDTDSRDLANALGTELVKTVASFITAVATEADRREEEHGLVINKGLTQLGELISWIAKEEKAK